MSDFARAEALLAVAAHPLGRPLHWLAETTSTNDLARAGVKAQAPHGSTWVADSQSQGRGRQGRTWVSPPGDNLLFSVLLRLECEASRLPKLSLAVGLAVCDAVAAACPGGPARAVKLKWPNDVVVVSAGVRRKIAGVLVEATLSGRSAEALVVGVGVNVHARSFPEALAARATSLALESAPAPDRVGLLAAILEGLARDVPLAAARGLAPLLPRLLAADALAGARVRSDDGVSGIASGIDVEGRLLVRTDDGATRRLGAGEVHLVEAAPPGAGAGC